MEKEISEKAYFDYWGKAHRKEDGAYEFHPLPYHCLDVAAVGQYLLKPGTSRNTDISIQTGLSPERIQYLFVTNLLLHDIGKFSESFQSLIAELYNELFPGKGMRKYEERHDTLGYVLWREVIKKTLADSNEKLADLFDILIKTGFGHHGLPPKESMQHGNAPLMAQTFFSRDDTSAANAYAIDATALLEDFPAFPEIDREQKQKLKYASWQFAGLGILADWVGSNADIFSYPLKENIPLANYWKEYAVPRAVEAVKKIEWKEKNVRMFSGIKDLFPFISNPSPLQKYAAETEINQGPKLWIIEDLTGSGKTEAAMILAQRMMAAGDADGLYIGLPSMATANAMYERLQNAYEKLYIENEMPSLVLSHGMRHLCRRFNDSIGLHNISDDKTYDNERTAGSYCNEWIADNRKKSLLADVGVGTIDQAIMGVLPARHQSLRLAGLHRKILIIDEVHAYDAYVGHLLGVLLEAHARNGGSVILLSATIPLQVRQKLIDDFKVGLETSIIDDQKEIGDFPLVTKVSGSGVYYWHPAINADFEKMQKIGVAFLNEKENVFNKIIQDASEGLCVCWIRNTVEDARIAFNELLKRGVPDGKIDLFHSRFAMIDRTRIENAALNNFGKKAGSAERTGRILIATQVVEQSLDLDFDSMISDLAPIDLLIQRAGRLHRHKRDKNGKVIEIAQSQDERPSPVITIFAPVFSLQPDKSWIDGEFKGTAAVYQHVGRLWLTYKILKEKGGWCMPADSRVLIESVYGEMADISIPEGLQSATIRAMGQQQAKEGMGHLNALILKNGYCQNAVRADLWDEDEKIQTRLSEENQELALAVYRNGTILPYADLLEYPWDWSIVSVSFRQWRKTGYELPKEFQASVEELKKKNPRLKHTEIVIVSEQSSQALSSNETICDYYSPRYGWGGPLKEEE